MLKQVQHAEDHFFVESLSITFGCSDFGYIDVNCTKEQYFYLRCDVNVPTVHTIKVRAITVHAITVRAIIVRAITVRTITVTSL
jgi:hypothetical protein